MVSMRKPSGISGRDEHGQDTHTLNLESPRLFNPKPVGRPKGCKDREPRMKRMVDNIPCCFREVQTFEEHWVDQVYLRDRQVIPNRAAYSSAQNSAQFAVQQSSVDIQLGQWDARIWCIPQNSDPFCHDWAPMCSEKINTL
mmetsp:Transcript_43147/g.90316  ORF Transcript_43147/g.90316 Transcript_43147/m.90316 type:complete len:141 (-) Transcript_43147:95-517(-)